MQRSRLKNIINKSKEKQIIREPFELFKKSLPEGIVNDNYRLKAAWEAYGKPKNYKEALWEGLILPIDENTYKMPSIGYNSETDEYEYLNTGKDNDIVAKDIRVWDNDVIPLVKELKLGGYVRTFNEEKDCWTYTKNSQKRELSVEDKGLQVIDSFLKGGRSEKESKNPDEMPIKAPSSLPSDLVKLIYNSNANFAKRLVDPNRKTLDLGNGEIGTHKLSYTTNDKGVVVYPEIQEINGELVDLSADRDAAYESAMQSGDYVIFPSEESAEWFTADNYKRYFPRLEKYAPQSRKFKQGGQMNVIPEGALHARKNNMELAKEGEITHKGIPVVDNEGTQTAEIERNEIIFNKETTDKIEELYKKFKSDEISNSEKDEIAIKAGKILTKLIIENTDDKTGLIEDITNKS